MGPVYDQPRETLTTEQVDASLRYQIMEVVDRIRWIPDFGYERELDWLRNMHDWMISKKRYWGLALPIYDCAACGTVEVIGGREELQRARGRGLGTVRGPHAASAVGRRGQDRLPDVRRAGRADQGRRQSRGSTPASCRSRRSTTARSPTTGRSGSRPTSSPRASPASSATGSTRCSRCRRSCAARSRSRRSSATPSSSARTAGRCTRAGATRSSSTRRPSGWASTSCAGCSPRRGPRRTSSSAGTPPTRRAASCSILWNVYAFFVTYARLAGWTPSRASARRRVAERPPLDRWILSRAAGHGRGRRGAPARRRRGRRDPRARRRSSTTCRPGTCACRATGSRGPTTPPTAPRRSRRSTTALVATSRMLAPILPFLSDAMYGNLVDDGRRGRARQRPPHPLAGRASWRGFATSALEAAMATARRAVELAADAARAARASRPASRWRTAWLAVPAMATARRSDAGAARRSSPREVNVKDVELIARRLGARRAAGEAAAAEDRQAARLGDPGGHGGGPRGRRRRSTTMAR